MATATSGGWNFDVNLIPSTDNEEILVAFVDVLVAAGWTVIARSDGTTVTSDGSENSASDWNNNNAWTHLRDPTGTGGRDLTIERGLSSQSLRVYQSLRGDPMTGGTPTAPPTPTGTQIQLVGTAGNFDTAFFNSTIASSRYHMGAGQTAMGETGDVYPFYLLRRATPGATGSKTMGVLPVKTVADGVTGDADSEPWIALTAASFASFMLLTGWYKAGLTGETAVVGGLTTSLDTNEYGLNPYTGAYDRPGVFVYDNTGGLLQRKGLVDESVLTWKGDGAHATLDTYQLATEGSAMAVFDSCAIRWPHTVAPLS